MGYSDYTVRAAEQEVQRILKSGKTPNLARIVSKYGLAGVDFIWLRKMVNQSGKG